MASNSESSSWRLALLAALALIVIALDQFSKRVVLDRLGPDGDLAAFTIIPGLLRFRFVRNTGAAFGMFQNNSAILTVLAIAVVIFLFYYFRRSIVRNSLLSVALGLQLGGAIGNIVDRLQHGYVVDFIDFPCFPTFNIADSAITIGVALLGLHLFFHDFLSHQDATALEPADSPLPVNADPAEKSVRQGSTPE